MYSYFLINNKKNDISCKFMVTCLKMLSKILVLVSIISIVVMTNYMILTEYNNEYYPDNFSIEHMSDQKYRCIRYFNDKLYNKYMYVKCKDYVYDYTDFILERSRYICMFYAHNLVMFSLFVIFYLLL